MNHVSLIGRLTKDPEIRYGSKSQTAVARFNLAINRGKTKDGKDLGVDYPGIICFGKTAEFVERYLFKGRLIAISGMLQTGFYEKDGSRIYTTNVLAQRIEFLDKAPEGEKQSVKVSPDAEEYNGFTPIDDSDIPF